MHDGVIARTRQNVSIFDLWPQFMTLTFEVWTWVFVATHCLHRVNICTKLFYIPLRHVGVIARTRQNVSIFYLWPQFMTSTFEVWTWVFVATHCLNGVNICTKLFYIPLRHVGVTTRTRQNVSVFDPSLWPWSLMYEPVSLLRNIVLIVWTFVPIYFTFHSGI